MLRARDERTALPSLGAAPPSGDAAAFLLAAAGGAAVDGGGFQLSSRGSLLFMAPISIL